MKLIERVSPKSYISEVMGAELTGIEETELLLENLDLYSDTIRPTSEMTHLGSAAAGLSYKINNDLKYIAEASQEYGGLSIMCRSLDEADVLRTIVGACQIEESNNPILLQIIHSNRSMNRLHVDTSSSSLTA